MIYNSEPISDWKYFLLRYNPHKPNRIYPHHSPPTSSPPPPPSSSHTNYEYVYAFMDCVQCVCLIYNVFNNLCSYFFSTYHLCKASIKSLIIFLKLRTKAYTSTLGLLTDWLTHSSVRIMPLKT